MKQPPSLDLALAAAAVAVTAVEGWALLPIYGPTWFVLAYVATCLGLSVTVALRRVFRRSMFCVSYALLAVMGVVVWAAPVNLGVSPLIVCAPLSLAVVARWDPPAWGAAALLLGLLGVLIAPTHRMPAPSHGLDAVMVLVMAGTYVWCTGRRRVALDYDRRLAEQREVMMVEAAAAQDRARAEERSRIARELHDVVAHSLTVVNVQAATALALGDPAGGRAALATIRDVSRQALAETRAVVHMLRTTETMDVSGELRTIVEVVDQVRAAGVQVECDLPDAAVLDGWQQQWPVATRLAVVRLVQESLTNVLRHGGKQASLTLGVDGSRVTLQVSNPLRADEPPHPPGFGLVGMRERVDLLGGSFAAGAVGERFLVTATIPVSQEVR